jgi:cell division protein FtsQ
LRKINYKKLFSLFLWVTVVAGLAGSLAFAAASEREVIASGVDVSIEGNDENIFITESEVQQFFTAGTEPVIAKRYRQIDIPALERKLAAHPAVSNAEVAADINGLIHVTVKQREPVLRVINKTGESYYIDAESRLMPLSDSYTARVLVATGEIYEPYSRRYQYTVNSIGKNKLFSEVSLLDDLLEVATAINADSVLAPLIHQIYVNKDREIELFPAVGHHRIILGEAAGVQGKLNKLKLFYAEGLSKADAWTKYGTINLKYKNLVVCTKK